MVVTYHYINTVLHVTADANWTSREETHNDVLTDSSITSGMPSLASYWNDTDSSDDDSSMGIIADVTKLYKNGEMEDEWSETMEE